MTEIVLEEKMRGANERLFPMGSFKRTKHVQKRLQQRGLENLVEFVCNYGECVPAGGRAQICYMSKRACSEACSELRGYLRKSDIDRLRRTFVVLSSDGFVITVGHRYKKLPH